MPGRMSELLLSYYGDDLTGSTDVMEALASRGVPTVLFIETPTAPQRARFENVRAIGLAGSSRSESPAWMDENLAPALDWLKSLGADFCHYKVCSTFDSSPTVGSIGRALEIGQDLFRQSKTPLVIGAPQLKRYTAFGNLFAAYQGVNYRIDRHPVMSRHPVTPMREADIRLHLAAQTARKGVLVDLTTIRDANADRVIDGVMAGDADYVLFDVADVETQREVGRQIWRTRREGGGFIVGSSGVEYALVSEWERQMMIPGEATFAAPGPVERIAVVSGSCSPTTERQIRFAQANGFDAFPVDPRALASGQADAVVNAIAKGLDSLARGMSVVFYTALGPESDIGGEIDKHEGARHAIGRALGQIERALIEQAGLTRAVIAGGDTSSHALRQLEIFALTTRLPLPTTPGSPLCVAHSHHKAFDGLEIGLKGGQVGNDDYFVTIRDGAA
jgi:3-oxoisoapionate kinase